MDGFKINHEGIRRMAKEIEKEFAKNPVRVPLKMSSPDDVYPAAATITNYNGPVVTVTGDHAQLAWSNGMVSQGHAQGDQIAPGFEQLATTVANLLSELPRFSLADDDCADVRTNAERVLTEVVTEKPDRGIIKGCVTMIKGLLSPLAAGISKAAADETAELAREMIHALGSAASF